MRSMSLAVAVLLAVTASTAIGFQTRPTEEPVASGQTPTAKGLVVPPPPDTGGPWRFSHPDDGMVCYGDLFFIGTGPLNSPGALSVYSYNNITPNGVYPNELQLQIAVIVDTDPGIYWTGPVYNHLGDGFATIMPTMGTPNNALLPIVDGEGGPGTGPELSSLALLGGGQGVLFRILAP